MSSRFLNNLYIPDADYNFITRFNVLITVDIPLGLSGLRYNVLYQVLISISGGYNAYIFKAAM